MTIKLTSRRCKCPACNEVFSCLSNFDKHRQGKGLERSCVAPTAVGLEKKEISGGYEWRSPSGGQWSEK